MNRELQNTASHARPGGKTNRFRTRSLEVTALGLASSAVTGDASAAVIYTPSVSISPDAIFSVDGSGQGRIQLISADAGGGEINLYLDAPGGMGMGMMAASTIELAVTPSGGDDFLSLLTVGNTIDANLGFANQAFLQVGPTTSPVWAPGTTGYAGFVFDNGGPDPLFGWMRLSFDANGIDFTVLEYAYEDSGGPIFAGVINPEPGTAILLGLGLVGFAALARVRRRARLSASAA